MRFAVVGGLAVSARTAPRFTRDADLAVSVRSDREAEELTFKLQNMGYAVFSSVEHQTAGRLATIRLKARSEPDVAVDLLFASSGIETELVEGAEEAAVFKEARLPVAQVGHLLALKLLSVSSRRKQDGVDLDALLAVAKAGDLRVASKALALIQKRGYAREKDLLADWRRVLAEFRATTGDR